MNYPALWDARRYYDEDEERERDRRKGVIRDDEYAEYEDLRDCGRIMSDEEWEEMLLNKFEDIYSDIKRLFEE
jgi:hypothetical protein